MRRLADAQRVVRDAVVTGDLAAARPLIVGGGDPARRLAIHHRHHRASLIGTLLTRFPALTWLVGGRVIEDAAAAYVREFPPTAPCMAEYGQSFPAFLAHRLDPDLAYVRPFGELEWHVGAVSIAVDAPSCSPELLPIDADALTDASVAMQPGVRYLVTEWPVDDLMKRYLTETAPETYTLPLRSTWLEVRGARDHFEISALDPPTWHFRVELQRGASLAVAALRALAIDDAFDPGRALVTLLNGHLVTGLHLAPERTSS
jgi:hypothetical protein